MIFEDLVLDGRNGLDLRIGRTYQSVASSVGNASLMVLPNSNGYLTNKLINDYSTYQIDRYNLGVGWSFSFPSVQVENEYIPQEVVDTYYYEEETELYYHSGNGEVYQVQFTSDTTDSNLKGYYNKDIQFNRNDKGYSNGQVTSFYSLTDADKTKQYFAEDGRLIGIVDRFGNTIKFEHELQSITNRVPQGTFAYREIEIDGDEFDEDMWFTSTDANGTYDAIQFEDTEIGSNDGYVMYFRRNNENGESYILSQPIQIKPLTYYNFGIGRFTSLDIKEENIANPLDMNRYVYCGNNPVKFIDPTGESYALTWGGSTWWLTGADGPLPIGDAIVVGGVIVGAVVDGVRILFAKKSKSSGKEKSSDVPSWAKGEKPKEGESGNDFAKRLMDKKYGKGNYKTGPGSEYNKLKKYGDRGGK